MTHKQQGVLAAVATVVIALWTIGTGGAHVEDRQGWHYTCPSLWTLLTASHFIDIEPVSTYGSGEDVEVYKDGVGEPDGRRAYGICESNATTRAAMSIVIVMAGLALAVYLALRPEPPVDLAWRRETALREEDEDESELREAESSDDEADLTGDWDVAEQRIADDPDLWSPDAGDER